MSKGKASLKAEKKIKSDSKAVAEPAFDPVLASLFASSSGPVTVPSRRVAPISPDHDKAREKLSVNRLSAEDIEETESDSQSEDLSESSEDEESEVEAVETRPRKRRRLSQEDDIEAKYLDRLAKEEQKEISERQKKVKQTNSADEIEEHSDDSASSASNDLADLSDLEPPDGDNTPQHESLTNSSTSYEKTRRTVFLGNVSINAIQSKSARKTLETHLKSALDTDTNTNANETIESLRFRSTAYNITAGPKKAAYAKKDLMDTTTKCTNAYVVLSTELAAKKIAKSLNGTVILDRHLNTDWLAHPRETDHKRSVFIGNLNFVDTESHDVSSTSSPLDRQARAKAKTPADAEEGLWTQFSKCGPVESVRVVRDPSTRVGKGFAYVQFSDEIGVEKALALDGKKFPPLLPRTLRVSRAKRVAKRDTKRKRNGDDEAGDRKKREGPRTSTPKTQVGFSSTRVKTTASASASASTGERKDANKVNGVVFEGYRASSDRAMKFRAKGKKKAGVKPPASRSSRRGAAFKAGGGKKKRDM